MFKFLFKSATPSGGTFLELHNIKRGRGGDGKFTKIMIRKSAPVWTGLGIAGQ